MKQKILKRTISFIITLSFIVGSLISMSFVVTHIRHHCEGEHCSICIQIGNAERVLNQLKSGANKLPDLPVIFGFITLLTAIPAIYAIFYTPVDLKTRIND